MMLNCDNCGRFVGKDGDVTINDEPYFIWWALCKKCCKHKQSDEQNKTVQADAEAEVA